MSTWGNATKKAGSFGVKGFLYGALAGAVAGVLVFLIAASITYGIGAGELVAQQIAATGWEGVVQMGSTAMETTAKTFSLGTFAKVAAWGAGVGSALGSACGILCGGVYGAVTDEQNPAPNLVAKIAHKITDKSPALANAITKDVMLHTPPTTDVSLTPGSANSQDQTNTAPVINNAPLLTATTPSQGTTTAYRDKFTPNTKDKLLTKSLETEVASSAHR